MLFWSCFTHLSAELQIHLDSSHGNPSENSENSCANGLAKHRSTTSRNQPENEDQNQQNMRNLRSPTNSSYILFSVILFHQDNVFFFRNLTEKNSQICIFAGRWIGLIIANYIVNRWKQTLINTNYGKITSLHHPDLLGLYFGPAIFCKVRKHGGTYGI